MMINMIEHATRVLGKAQGYLGLPVRDVVYPDGTQTIQMSWSPTPDELKRLNEGKSIILELFCYIPPPMKMTVPE